MFKKNDIQHDPNQSYDIRRFQRPIPGQGLTVFPGSLSMQKPPQFTKRQDALEYVFSWCTQPKTATRILLALKSDVPAELIARTICFSGVLQGKWLPAMSLLMIRPVLASIVAIGHRKLGNNFKIMMADKNQKNFVDGVANKLKGRDTQVLSGGEDQGSQDQAPDQGASTPSKPTFGGLV